MKTKNRCREQTKNNSFHYDQNDIFEVLRIYIDLSNTQFQQPLGVHFNFPSSENLFVQHPFAHSEEPEQNSQSPLRPLRRRRPCPQPPGVHFIFPSSEYSFEQQPLAHSLELEQKFQSPSPSTLKIEIII